MPEGMRPAREQHRYRVAFCDWVLEGLGAWGLDEAQTFELDGERRGVDYLLSKLEADTVKVRYVNVRERLGLEEGATWAEAVARAREELSGAGA